MNKKELSEALSKKIDLNKKECLIVFEIMEKYPLIGEKARLMTIDNLISKLDIDKDKAITVYDAARELIKQGIKDSLRHPFRSKD